MVKKIDSCFECPVCKKPTTTVDSQPIANTDMSSRWPIMLVCNNCYLADKQKKYDAEQTAKFNAEQSDLHNPVMRGWE